MRLWAFQILPGLTAALHDILLEQIVLLLCMELTTLHTVAISLLYLTKVPFMSLLACYWWAASGVAEQLMTNLLRKKNIPEHILEKCCTPRHAVVFIIFIIIMILPLHSRRLYSHVTPLLRSLHWLPVAARIHFKVLTLAYAAANKTAPHYLQHIIQAYTPAWPLRSAATGRLAHPPSRATGLLILTAELLHPSSPVVEWSSHPHKTCSLPAHFPPQL